MKKKLTSILLAAAMTTAVLTGCGGETAQTSGETTQSSAPAETTQAAAEGTEVAATEAAGETADNSDIGTIYLVSKGFQHQFWQAVYQGANEAAAEYGVEIDFQGPDNESAYAQQVQMLNNAINNNRRRRKTAFPL